MVCYQKPPPVKTEQIGMDGMSSGTIPLEFH